jgi:hypothetical protein
VARKIKLNRDASEADAMAAVRQTAEGLGYLFEQHDARSAMAHEGGKRVKGRVTATRARLGVGVNPGWITIKSETNGTAYMGGANTPFFMLRIHRRYKRFAQQVERELARAGLA